MIMKKHYKTLGIEEGASPEEIKAAYTKLSKDLNPAVNDNQEFFIEEYAKVQDAYTALTGKTAVDEKEPKAPAEPDIVDLFKDSDSIISVLKKYRGADDTNKLAILKSLETFKGDNQTYQEALAVLYKKEDITGLKAEKEEKKPVSSGKESSENTPEQTPTDKTPKKTKKTLFILAFILLLFGVPYIYFLTKVNAVKNELPRISENSEFIQNESKTRWQSKFYKDHPEIVAIHLTDNTNKGFYYKEEDRSYTKDTLVSFFLYKKAIPVTLYHSKFFQCVYQDAVNSNSFWRHYTVGLSSKKAEKKSKLPYFRMRNKVRKKFRVTDKEFEDLIALVGGLKVFQNEERLPLDFDCSKCIKNYTTKHITNDVAINEFYEFAFQYIKNQRSASNSNKESLKKYKKDYSAATSGMSSTLKAQLEKKIAKKSLITTENKKFSYSGTTDGIGQISYAFKNSEYNLKPLSGYVNEVYAAYYSKNSLYTGATPYKYCYGKTPYCSPPRGFAECSFIDINASSNSDVVVIIKKNNRVYSHAYIKAGGYYKFKLGNGSFQAFFYYGKGWNPNKYIKTGNCGKITGGFVKNESVDKSGVINLYNGSMTYTLYSVKNGNFSPKTSSKNEAF